MSESGNRIRIIDEKREVEYLGEKQKRKKQEARRGPPPPRARSAPPPAQGRGRPEEYPQGGRPPTPIQDRLPPRQQHSASPPTRRPPPGAHPPDPRMRRDGQAIERKPASKKKRRPPNGKPIPRGTAMRTVERVKRRHRNMILFYIFLFFTIVAGAVALSLTVLFQIDAIEVEGSSRYPAQELIASVGIQKGENLFLAKTNEGEQAVLKEFPYIGAVEVSRRFPAKILIQVEEDIPVGAIEVEGGFALLGKTGKVLDIAEQRPADCPILRGLAADRMELGQPYQFTDEKAAGLLSALTKALTDSGMDKISAIDVSDVYNLKLIYDGRISMELGIATDLDKKLRYAQVIFEKDTEIRDRLRGTMQLSDAANNEGTFLPNFS